MTYEFELSSLEDYFFTTLFFAKEVANFLPLLLNENFIDTSNTKLDTLNIFLSLYIYRFMLLSTLYNETRNLSRT